MTARPSRHPPQGAPRVIVVGAGFAGLAAVKELHRAGAQVLLIDRNIYSTFQPLLYQVATGGLNPGDVAYRLGMLARRKAARFRMGELAGIDPAARQTRRPSCASLLSAVRRSPAPTSTHQQSGIPNSTISNLFFQFLFFIW